MILYTGPVKTEREARNMMEQIRYRLLMRRLRWEIARTVADSAKGSARQRRESKKSSGVTACKACGSIV
jgi:hypothetical protein